MHPVLLILSGTALKVLCLVALFATPVMLARRRRKHVSLDDLALFLWCLIVALVGFALGSPNVQRLGVLRSLMLSSSFTQPWSTLPIYSYGVMLALAHIAGARLGLHYSRKMLMPDRDFALWAITTAASAFFGARALYVLVQWKVEFLAPGSGLILWDKLLVPRSNGFVVYGGLITGTLSTIVYCIVRRYSIWRVTDMGTITIALGLMLGRTGCFLAGCDFGRPLTHDAPAWLHALGTFPRWPDHKGSPAWWQHMISGFQSTQAECAQLTAHYRNGRCFLDEHTIHSMPVHPTQLYELSLGLTLLAVQLWLWPRRKFDGQVALTFMVLYGLARSALELLRDDIERGHTLGLTTSQWIGLSTAAAGTTLLLWRWRTAPPPSFNMRRDSETAATTRR